MQNSSIESLGKTVSVAAVYLSKHIKSMKTMRNFPQKHISNSHSIMHEGTQQSVEDTFIQKV